MFLFLSCCAIRFAQLHEIRANVDKSLDTLYLSHLNRICKCTTVLLSTINDMMLNKSLDVTEIRKDSSGDQPLQLYRSDEYVGDDGGHSSSESEAQSSTHECSRRSKQKSMQGIQECNLHTMNLAYLVGIPGVKTKENYSIQPLLGLIYSVFLAFSLVHH